MIFDGGGPGMSNLSRIDARYEQVVIDAHVRRLNVLIMDEPWVVAQYDLACRSAMASLYRESAQRYPQLATANTTASVRRTCLSSSVAATTTAADYRVAVRQIEQVQKITVVRLEGYSFASVRAAYLGAVRSDLVAAISTPFPVGANAADFYTAVAAAGKTQSSTASGSLVTDSALAYYAITSTSPKDMDHATAAQSLWQVNNAGDMSLSRVGYYSEICAALTNWTALTGRAHQDGSALTAFASVHAPCAAGDQIATLKLPTKTCFAVLAGDPNSPWIPSPLTGEAHIETIAKGEHGRVKTPACQ